MFRGLVLRVKELGVKQGFRAREIGPDIMHTPPYKTSLRQLGARSGMRRTSSRHTARRTQSMDYFEGYVRSTIQASGSFKTTWVKPPNPKPLDP